MGLIQAAVGSVGGVLADQWKEFFYCDSLDKDTLVAKGQKRVSGRSSNTSATDNIISSGSVIAVNEGQCMIIVEQGKVVEICAEPGAFTYDSSTEPTVFGGNLASDLAAVFKNIGKRFTFGGDAPKDQRIYYFNTKEIMGNKYGTAQSIQFETMIGQYMLNVNIRCFGEYSYRITNPILFYTNVCGNVADVYERSEIDSQLKSELLTALQPAFGRIAAKGIRYTQLINYTKDIRNELADELSDDWSKRRGIEIVSFGVSSVKADEEDEKRIKEIQDSAYKWQMDVESGARVIVGVNKFQVEEEAPKNLLRVDASVGEKQKAKVEAMKAKRDNAAVQAALADLKKACSDENENLMPHILSAVKTYATLGEICGVMREVFGEYEAHVNL